MFTPISLRSLSLSSGLCLSFVSGPCCSHLLDKVALVVFTVLGYYTGKHHLDDDLVWLLAGMPVLIVSVIWGINELMAWMNGK